jgi:hypothetical protein
MTHPRGAYARNISINSEAEMEKNDTATTPATALASRVFPVLNLQQDAFGNSSWAKVL